MSGVTTPNPECLPDTVIPLRKSARIQSKRSLSHESTHNPPSLLNKPLEVGLPTTSGFIGVLGIKNNQPFVSRLNNPPFVSHLDEPNISYSGSYHTSQIAPTISPTLDLITTSKSGISVTSHDSNMVQTIVGDSRLHITKKDNVLNTSLGSKSPQITQSENTMPHFTHNIHTDNMPYTIHSDAKISLSDSYSPRSMGCQFQHDIKGDSSMHIISGNHNVIKPHHQDSVGCPPHQVASEVRDSNHAVPTDNLEHTTEQELQMVEMQILSQAKRLKQLKLQQKKNTLLSMNKEAHQIELDMQSSCRVPIQHSLPRRAEDLGINGPEHAKGEYYNVDDNLMRTTQV